MKPPSHSQEADDLDSPLAPGLYLTATPIGCLEDLSLRALRVLRSCSTIFCEDSRVSRKLLNHYAIETPLEVYQDHNADQVRPHIVRRLQQGEALALISDAGMPLVSDPGFKLVRDCHALGLNVTVVPGASAFLTAGVLSGFPTAPLTFLGFASNLKESFLRTWAGVDSTLVFFEAPHKLLRTLSEFQSLFPGRSVAVLRELTKVFEERVAGTFDEVLQHFEETPPRGECVLVLSPPDSSSSSQEDLVGYLTPLLKSRSLRDAVELTAAHFQTSKKFVYRLALTLVQENGLGPNT